eukprot:GHVR01047673.1.p1 GENE.GHVR01047673.1~~GHVR01047673.1.p1  ORF type:complete len:130 (-),score=55.26 GHVR01047673.1:21-410(-)
MSFKQKICAENFNKEDPNCVRLSRQVDTLGAPLCKAVSSLAERVGVHTEPSNDIRHCKQLVTAHTDTHTHRHTDTHTHKHTRSAWYISFFGTAKEHQGKGFGRTLYQRIQRVGVAYGCCVVVCLCKDVW